ncbi:MAG: hypothetical protein NT033_01800 [Candidatus Omnitrophica bacterium]|nr:hypothetical protein [Candidatus Omnitrophota bacterium]
MRAFTLLEVLLAVVLLTLGLVSIITSLNVGLFAGGVNEEELLAVNLLREKAEEVRNANYSSIASEVKATVTELFQFSREVIVTIPQTNLKQVQVKVYWFAKGTETNLNLTTYVSNI